MCRLDCSSEQRDITALSRIGRCPYEAHYHGETIQGVENGPGLVGCPVCRVLWSVDQDQQLYRGRVQRQIQKGSTDLFEAAGCNLHGGVTVDETVYRADACITAIGEETFIAGRPAVLKRVL